MLPSAIGDTLRKLRGVLRFCVAIDGASKLCFVVVFLVFLDMGADRFLEWSLGTRAILLATMVVGLAYLFWKMLLSRLCAPVRNGPLAALLERMVPEFDESLITSIELGGTADAWNTAKSGGSPPDETTLRKSDASRDEERDEECFAVFFEATVAKATGILKSVDVRTLFRIRRLYGQGILALSLLVVLAGFCAVFHESARIWFCRNVLLADVVWPRLSRISVEGFDENGRVRIARGDSFPLLIKASVAAPRVPNKVLVHIAPADDPNRETKTISIDQFGSRIDEHGAEFRRFLHTIPELLDSVVLTIHAADTRIEGLTIEVVPPPNVIHTELTLHYPRYMQREHSSLQPTDRVSIPEGTSVALRMRTNKPIRSASVARNGQNAIPVLEHSADVLRHTLEDLREPTHLEVTLEDFDGIRNRRPIRLDMDILKDQPPSVAARLDGIGQAVTPVAVLPVLGEITDDYGLTEIYSRFSLTKSQKPVWEEDSESDSSESDGHVADDRADDGVVDNGTTGDDGNGDGNGNGETEEIEETEGVRPIHKLDGIATHRELNESFSVSGFLLLPGDRLKLRLEAVDGFSLPANRTGDDAEQREFGPQVGLGDLWDLEIVSETRLRTLLETREIGLRQRFEALIAEARRTRDILDAMDFEKTAAENTEETNVAEANVAGKNIAETTETAETRPAEESAANIDETDSAKKNAEESNVENAKKKENAVETKREVITPEQAARGAYDVSRVLRDSEKEKYELQGIIAGFSGIRKEMVNNQIFTPETRQRIDEKIIEPMRVLTEKDFYEFDETLKELTRRIQQRETTSRRDVLGSRSDSLTQLDRILSKMNAILDQMLQMETFNEAIELLKEIIREQESLHKETDEAKNKQLRNLLE